MGEKVVYGITFLVLILCFYIFVIKGVKSRAERRFERFKRNNWIVTAEEIDMIYSPREDNHSEEYYVKYKYVVDGRSYKRTLLYKNHDYPTSVNFYYNKNKPGQSYAQGMANNLDARKRSFGCLLCILIPGIIGALLMKIFGISR